MSRRKMPSYSFECEFLKMDTSKEHCMARLVIAVVFCKVKRSRTDTSKAILLPLVSHALLLDYLFTSYQSSASCFKFVVT